MQRRVGSSWEPLTPDGLAKCSREVRRRHRLELAGLAVVCCAPLVSTSCEYNAAKAALFRVFTAPKYRPEAQIFQLFDRHREWLLPGFTEPIEAMSVDDWIASMPSRRRTALRRAAINVRKFGWREAWLRFKAFVKSEKLPGFDVDDNPLADPKVKVEMMDRLIQGPADEAHVLMGPLIKPLTLRLKQIWNYQNHIYYAATSVDKLNDWFRRAWRPGTMAVMADYSKFDNSHSDQSWDWIENLYREIGLTSSSPVIPRILAAWRRPKGYMSGQGWALRYFAETMNASGRDDTALSNALLNGNAMFLSLVASCLNKSVWDVQSEDLAWGVQNVRLAVCGDDTLAFVPQVCAAGEGFRTALSKSIASFGFCAEAEKLKISSEPFDFVFLGMRPYPVGDEWFFGKTIGRALYKMGWKLDPVCEDMAAWFAGECVATLSTQRHVPIISDVAKSFLLQHGRGKIRSADRDSWKETEMPGIVTPDYDQCTERYVEDGYGLWRGALAEFREHLSCISYPGVTAHPVATWVCTHDEL